MESFDWDGFLRRWNEELLSDERVRERLPAKVLASGWLGLPGASPTQIKRAERRLGTTLPPSYRAFLTISNGWWWAADAAGPLWPVRKIEWFRARHADLIRDWPESRRMVDPAHLSVPDEDYFVYGEEQESETLRYEYLPATLEISDMARGDAHAYLLNPHVTTPEGEWEAWDYASWYPGAHRHRSFQELMQAQHRLYRSTRGERE